MNILLLFIEKVVENVNVKKKTHVMAQREKIKIINYVTDDIVILLLRTMKGILKSKV